MLNKFIQTFLRNTFSKSFAEEISPYTNTRSRCTLRAVSCCNHPLWMNQSSSTKCVTRTCPDLGLPRPSSLWGLSTTDNACAGLISTFSWSTTTATTAIADFTALLTVFFHVLFILTFAVTFWFPEIAVLVIVCTTWKQRTKGNSHSLFYFKVEAVILSEKNCYIYNRPVLRSK